MVWVTNSDKRQVSGPWNCHEDEKIVLSLGQKYFLNDHCNDVSWIIRFQLMTVAIQSFAEDTTREIAIISSKLHDIKRSSALKKIYIYSSFASVNYKDDISSDKAMSWEVLQQD